MDNNINKQDVLQCRSCNEIFVASDRKVKYIHIFGMVIEEKICPHCGSHTYGLVDYPVSEEKLQCNMVNYNRSKKSHDDKDDYFKDYIESYEEEINELFV